MSWRPEGWKNPYPEKIGYCGNNGMATTLNTPVFIDNEEYKIYETGADAMLGALRKQVIPMNIYQAAIKGAIEHGVLNNKQPYSYLGIKGTLVFIPGEEGR